MVCISCKTSFCYRCGHQYFSVKFLGDHFSRYSPFGCRYNLLPDRPKTRRLVRGAVFSKLWRKYLKEYLYLATYFYSRNIYFNNLFYSRNIYFLTTYFYSRNISLQVSTYFYSRNIYFNLFLLKEYLFFNNLFLLKEYLFLTTYFYSRNIYFNLFLL